MRKIILLISVFIYAGIVTSAQGQEIEENSKDSEFGLVYFIRGKGHAGSATAFSALIDDKRVCQLNNRKYSVHEVPPGPHEFKAQFGGKKGKKKAEVAPIDVEAGGTYYIQMVRQSTFMVNDVIAQEITRNSALRLIEDDNIELDPNCRAED